MESRFSPVVDGAKRKQYCDKSFKNALGKSLVVNNGDPNNIHKINNAKRLQEYPPERIIDYTNILSSNIQNAIEDTIEDPEVQNMIKLAKNMESFTKGDRADELKSVTKLLSQSDKIENFRTTNNVDFNLLHKYIDSAVSGLPDVVTLDERSRNVLFGAYKDLMEQVDKDATPEFLSELKNAIRSGEDTSKESKFPELSKCFNQPSINPLALPFSFIFNGVTPDLANNEQTDVEMNNSIAENTSS
ncbi:unnamed protein product [Diamesa hyperborea]